MNMSSTKRTQPRALRRTSQRAIFLNTLDVFPRLSASIQHSYLPRKMGNRQNSDLQAASTNLGYLGLHKSSRRSRMDCSLRRKKPSVKWNEHSVQCQRMHCLSSIAETHCVIASSLNANNTSKPCTEPRKPNSLPPRSLINECFY